MKGDLRSASKQLLCLGIVLLLAVVPLAVCSAHDDGATIPMFVNDTANAGLSFSHAAPGPDDFGSETTMQSPGVAVSDVDRDGYLDVFVQGGKGQNAALFINQRDGTFANRTSQWNIDLTAEDGLAVTVGDIDGNGYLDIIVGATVTSKYNDNHKLLLHSGPSPSGSQRRFSNPLVIQNNNGRAVGAGFGLGDIELDGDLDLFAASWYEARAWRSQLYVNDGTGTLQENQGQVDIQLRNWGTDFTPTFADMDEDGYPELLLAADFGFSQYFRNDTGTTGTPRFTLTQNGTGLDESGMGSALGDIDNDGDLDWLVTAIYDPLFRFNGNRLYRNEGDHQFSEISQDVAYPSAGPDQDIPFNDGGWGWGASFGDINNDGRVDLACTNGSSPNPNQISKFASDPTRLWVNRTTDANQPQFQEAAHQAGITDTGLGRGLVFFDADNDGDLDIIVSQNGDDLIFYRNQLNPSSKRWLAVELFAPAANAPDGIGAKVEIAVGTNVYRKHMLDRSSFVSHEPYRLHFGFPETERIDRLTVTWPDGSQKVLHEVAPGQILRINSGDLNADDLVDAHDVAQLAAALASPETPLPSNVFVRADLDLNGDVDVNDLAALTNMATSQ